MTEVRCITDAAGWSACEVVQERTLVLVQRGAFYRRADASEQLLQPSWAYLSAPAQEERFAHPSGSDLCTSVRLPPETIDELVGEAPAIEAIRVGPRNDGFIGNYLGDSDRLLCWTTRTPSSSSFSSS